MTSPVASPTSADDFAALAESGANNLPPTSSTSKPVTHRLDAGGSVQAVVVDGEILIAGLQGGQIAAWSIKTFEQLTRIDAHEQSVLSLHLSLDRNLLFSCGVDSVVNVWILRSFELVYSLYSHFEIGDIFSLAYSPSLQTIFCGAQNASIQWRGLQEDQLATSPTASSPIVSHKHRFFDSVGPGSSSTLPEKPGPTPGHSTPSSRSFYFSRSHYLPFAHKSYVYCMTVFRASFVGSDEEEVLITGGGDGAIKVWGLAHLWSEGLVQIHKFKTPAHSVLSLAHSGPFLYAGLSDGGIYIYNLSSQQLVQRLAVPYGDLNSIRVLGGVALCGTSRGWVKKIDAQFSQAGEWEAHNGKILASCVVRGKTNDMYITAGNDSTIAFWDVSECTRSGRRLSMHGNDELNKSLKDFVAFRSIASNSQYIGDCHQAVDFLRRLLTIFGATTTLWPIMSGGNPIVVAKFAASEQPTSKRTVLFYGHYDVVEAEPGNNSNFEDWIADPFQLHPLNGFLYGRGVTDNKGPILAAVYAVADLVQSHSLSCNVVFLLEGEEEAGSRGFQDTVQRNRPAIGNVDYILLSNSYWLDDHIPCLTYGMRGVIHATVTVSSGKPDRHSGMDGKARQHEPLKDLTVVLSSLTGSSGTQIMIPGFYDQVNSGDDAESRQYLHIAEVLAPGHPEIRDKRAFAESLMQRWREPNLTIHRIEVPESRTAATISRFAKASLSIRIVPRQDAAEVADALRQYLQAQFEKLKSTNHLEVAVTSKADAWLGHPGNQIFQALEKAIMSVWNSEAVTGTHRSFASAAEAGSDVNPPQKHTATVPKKPPYRRASSLASKGTFTLDSIPRKPLYIREGGSIPAISFLEREFQAPAAMFPMGQSSDNAHLSNERMRVENLYNGREVLRKVFSNL